MDVGAGLESAWLRLVASPNPDIICCFKRLDDAFPVLEILSGDGLAIERAVIGRKQGHGRFFWEPMDLPDCCCRAPFIQSEGKWGLMFHLWRPKETGVLQARVYLKHTLLDKEKHAWQYYIRFPDTALADSPAHMETFLVPINLSVVFSRPIFSAWIHAVYPDLGFDLRLTVGPAHIYDIRKDGEEIQATVKITQDGRDVLNKANDVRKLGIRCDGGRCCAVPSLVNDGPVAIFSSIDTGPWHGLLVQDEHFQS